MSASEVTLGCGKMRQLVNTTKDNNKERLVDIACQEQYHVYDVGFVIYV